MRLSSVKRILAYVILGYVVITAVYFLFQDYLVFKPNTSTPSKEIAGVGNMQTVKIKTKDNLKLTAWYTPPQPGYPLIVYFHGNAGNIERRGPDVKAYMNAGYGVLLLSYRGYGDSEGKPSEKGLYTDARSALAWLKERGYAQNCLVYFGESLGTGVAVQMAAEKPPAALVLQTPFTSLIDMAAYHYPFLPSKYLVRHRFDSITKIDRIKTPQLYILARQDTLTPVEYGIALYNKAREPKTLYVEDDADHGTLQQVNEKTLAFLDQQALKCERR